MGLSDFNTLTEFVNANESRLGLHPEFSAAYEVIDTPRAMLSAQFSVPPWFPLPSPEHHTGTSSGSKQPIQSPSDNSSSSSKTAPAVGVETRTEKPVGRYCGALDAITQCVGPANEYGASELASHIINVCELIVDMSATKSATLRNELTTGLCSKTLKECVAAIARAFETKRGEMKIYMQKLNPAEQRDISNQVCLANGILRETYSVVYPSGFSRIAFSFLELERR